MDVIMSDGPIRRFDYMASLVDRVGGNATSSGLLKICMRDLWSFDGGLFSEAGTRIREIETLISMNDEEMPHITLDSQSNH